MSHTDPVGRLYALPHGRASMLFVLVAGVGVTLLARSRRATPADARLTLLWRSALLLPAGLLLQQLDHGVNVILQAYAVLFVLAAVALALRDRWLVAVTATLAVVGPLAYWYGSSQQPLLFDRSGDIGASVGEVAHRLLLAGPYPVVTWIAPLLFGMWLGRRDLTDLRLQRRLVAVGGCVAAGSVVIAEVLTMMAGPLVDAPGSPWRFAVATPHSQMPLWLVGSTAAAAAVLGASLWAAARWQRLVRPLVVTGQLALTVYVGHLVVLHLAPEALRSDHLDVAVLVVLGFTVAAVAASVAWRARFARGPLETVLRPPSSLRARR